MPRRSRRSRLVVAHAGIGSIVSAAEIGRPIVVLPRRAAFGEHTSDHQVETVSRLHGRPGVHVAETEADLAGCIAAVAAAAADGAADGEDRRSRLHRPPAPLHRGLNAPRVRSPGNDVRETITGIFSPKTLTPRSNA